MPPAAIIQSMSGKHPTWYAFIRWLVKVAYYNGHGGITPVNPENMPATGGVLLAPLHLSHLDPPAAAVASRRRLRFMAKDELFTKNKLFGALITSLGAYPVKRGAVDTEAIRRTIALLAEGEVVLVFPEGTRGDGETIQDMSPGVAVLAKKTGVPVVPMAIIGTNIVMPQGKFKGRKHPMTLAFGKPYTYKDVATGASERENRELFLSDLQQRIARLCHENGLPLKIAPKHSGSEAGSNLAGQSEEQPTG
jgi:1-acyl-sn-glycerol-3-phosphate acyltransferase